MARQSYNSRIRARIAELEREIAARQMELEASAKRLTAITIGSVIDNDFHNPNKQKSNWRQTARKYGAAALKTIFGGKNSGRPVTSFA